MIFSLTNVAWYKWYVSKINEWHTRACIPNPNKKHYITQRLLRKVAILDIPGAKEKTTVENNHSIIDHSFILNKTLSIYCKSSNNYRLHKSYRSLYSVICVNHSANFGSSRSITIFHPMEDTNSYDVCLLIRC